jgi:hypothetical protein
MMLGGGAGLAGLAAGPAAAATVPAGAVVGAAIGAAIGAALGGVVDGVYANSASEGGGGGRASPSDRAAGLRRQLAEHEKKLADYKANPSANDNLGLLKNATGAQRDRIIQGRIRNLEGQIRNFTKQIEQIEKGNP